MGYLKNIEIATLNSPSKNPAWKAHKAYAESAEKRGDIKAAHEHMKKAHDSIKAKSSPHATAIKKHLNRLGKMLETASVKKAKEVASKPYYTMFEWSTEDKRWEINFGDYDKSTVKEELESMNHIANGTKKKNFMIVQLANATNDAAYAKVAELTKMYPNGPVAKPKVEKAANDSKSYFFVFWLDARPKVEELNKISGLDFRFDKGNHWVEDPHWIASTTESDPAKLNAIRDKLKQVKLVMDVQIERGHNMLNKAGKWIDTPVTR